jgi:phosphatidylethanolamine/phosphatidyl-N-methylethanolamine N-methyltransferase
MSGIKFLKNFIKSPGTIGAICPSSTFLAKMITDGIGVEEASAIVELGPGTGVFTSCILHMKKPDSKFFAVELNRDFYDVFKQKFPEVKIYNENATDLNSMARREDIESVDVIICGLPWAAFPAQLQDDLLNAISDVLTPGGCFTTFAYLQGVLLPAGMRFKKTLKKHFSSVETSRTEWRNFPPAFVYRCYK